MKNSEIEKYINRSYNLDEMSIEEYLILCKELSKPSNYQNVIDANKKYDKFSSILRKRVNPNEISIKDFEQILEEISNAENDNEIGKIMTKYHIPWYMPVCKASRPLLKWNLGWFVSHKLRKDSTFSCKNSTYGWLLFYYIYFIINSNGGCGNDAWKKAEIIT